MAHWISVLEVAQVNKGLHYFGATVPCTVRLAASLCDGRKVFVHGVPKFDAGRFSVNLQDGTSDDADICFHMDVRFDQGVVVFNSRQDGTWQEEVVSETICNFEKDKPFLVELTSSGDGYDVVVNSDYVQLFPHRLPPEKSTHIDVLGDLRLPGLHFPMDRIPDGAKITIPGNVRLGTVFTVGGYFKPEEARFDLNLRCGEEDDSDIIFHFNPRYDSQTVIRNARIEGQWGPEEEEAENFPFERNRDFGLMIVPRKLSYHVWVNGRKFVAFPHRQEMSTASVLTLEGGAVLDDVSIDSPPESMPAGSGFEELIFQAPWREDIYNPSNPVELAVDQLRKGNVLCVSAVIPTGADRFHINFQGEGENSDNPDIMFHYNPRMSLRQVILNTRENGEWQNEVRWSSFPFRERGRFEIIVHCAESCFEISVNDESPRNFPFRINSNRVRKIVVDGEITVKRFIFM